MPPVRTKQSSRGFLFGGLQVRALPGSPIMSRREHAQKAAAFAQRPSGKNDFEIK
jgi:hypothetical protein